MDRTETEQYARRRARAKREADRARFTDNDITALKQAAGVKAKQKRDDLGRTLPDRLMEIAHSFLVNHLWQQKPSPTKIKKRLNAVQRAAKALYARLPREHVFSHRFFHSCLTAQAAVTASNPELTREDEGSRRLRAATAAVQDIIAWSAAAINRESARIQPRRSARHRGDQAMQQLIGDLNGVWVDYWQEIPGTSTGGPYTRFVRAFLACVEDHLTAEDFAADRSLRNALRASAQAIRERVQRTQITRAKHGGKSRP